VEVFWCFCSFRPSSPCLLQNISFHSASRRNQRQVSDIGIIVWWIASRSHHFSFLALPSDAIFPFIRFDPSYVPHWKVVDKATFASVFCFCQRRTLASFSYPHIPWWTKQPLCNIRFISSLIALSFAIYPYFSGDGASGYILLRIPLQASGRPYFCVGNSSKG